MHDTPGIVIDDPSRTAPTRPAAIDVPSALGVREFATYARVIDARSPREYADDHIPGAVNLPVVDDAQYAEVGTRHRTDAHGAYVVGVGYALRNIAQQIDALIAQHRPDDRFLVYCFRGGKRSKLWVDALRTIGFDVDVLTGGWKCYRRWVLAGLDALPATLRFHVLCGPTGGGKTRLLAALSRAGAQVLDLEALAAHRGSVLGGLPEAPQPSQKAFETRLWQALARLDPRRPIYVESESRKIGDLRVPEPLIAAMWAAPCIVIEAETPLRVALLMDEYAHFLTDRSTLANRLSALTTLHGRARIARWLALADENRHAELVAELLELHYDPAYRRSIGSHYAALASAPTLAVSAHDGATAFDRLAAQLTGEESVAA